MRSMRKRKQWKTIVKVGRTHLQDATPLTLGQEFSGYVCPARPRDGRDAEKRSTGVRSRDRRHRRRHRAQRASRICRPRGEEDRRTDRACRSVRIPTNSPRSHRTTKSSSHRVRSRRLPAALMKIANDIRWLGSGPRAGIGELILPENEPGQLDHAGQGQPDAIRSDDDGRASRSSATTSPSASAGRRAISNSTFQSGHDPQFLALDDVAARPCRSFREHCVEGLVANEAVIKKYLDESLMLGHGARAEDRLRQSRRNRKKGATTRAEPQRNRRRPGLRHGRNSTSTSSRER